MTSLQEEFKNAIDNYSNKFEIETYDNYYIEKGFVGVLKIKIPLILTQKEFAFGSAKARVIGDKLYVQGFLNDLKYLLKIIS